MTQAGMRSWLAGIAAAALMASAASAQTIKIGVVNSFSGPQASFGDLTDKAFRLYMKLHGSELPAGVKIELLNRDDGGPNPDKAKQLAQELIVRDRVDMIAGIAFTPNAMAIAPIATQAKVPVVITNAGTAVITTRSPYIVRFSFTVNQHCVLLGQWAAKTLKKTYTLVADFAPGHDCEEDFTKAYKGAGGEVAGALRVPVATNDFAPFMQRVKDANPNALMVFIPAGRTATALMKAFSDLGLKGAGVKLIGTGDISPEDELPNMSDDAIGSISMFHYSAHGDRPANKAFVAAWHKEYGEQSTPNFVAAASWDAMAGIFAAIKDQKGKMNADRTVEVLRNFKMPDSPRGPSWIDPETRDIVQNEYLREVRRVDGQLVNFELETAGVAVKDPWKASRNMK